MSLIVKLIKFILIFIKIYQITNHKVFIKIKTKSFQIFTLSSTSSSSSSKSPFLAFLLRQNITKPTIAPINITTPTISKTINKTFVFSGSLQEFFINSNPSLHNKQLELFEQSKQFC